MCRKLFLLTFFVVVLGLSGSASAQLIVYEPFDYPANGLSGNDGGSGWNGAWDGGQQVTAPGLAFSPLLVKGNKATVVGGDSFRNLPEPMGDNETQLWISFIGQADQQPGADMWGGVSFHEPDESLFLGVPWQAGPDDKVWGLDTKGDENRLTEIPITEKIFFVVRIDFNTDGDNDTVTAWARSINDPDPFDLTDETAFAQYTTRNIEFSRVRIAGAQPVNFDEIRLGMTPEDVLVLGIPDLLAWWTCDEGAGAVVGDASGNGNDGTFVNGDPAWVEGIRGNAVELVGPTLVEVPPLNVELTEATMAGWIKPNGAQPDWSSIIMTRDPGLATGFNVLGFQLAYHWNDDSGSWSHRGGDMIAEDDWTFVAVTIEPDKATFYVNGVAGSVNEISHGPCIWNSNIYLGGDGTEGWVSRRMNGALDDVSLFSRALTADEILAAMEGIGLPGANIIWVSDAYDDNADGAPDDEAWVDLLAAQGHTVDYQYLALGDGYWRTLDDAKIAALNAADLIIVSRNSSSGDYDDGDEVAQWNSVTTPIILSSTHIVRNSRWKWLDTGDTLDLAPMMDLADGSQIQAIDETVGQCSFAGIEAVGNGTLLASGDGLVWVVEWEAGVEFYPGSVEIAGGPRIFFVAGTQEVTDAVPPIGRGEMNLTPEGVTQFLKAVNSLLPAVDVTSTWDMVQGVPNDGLRVGTDFGWPGGETPDLAIDDDTGTKFLHFKGELEPTGFQVTPLDGPTIVTGLTFTTANDAAERDPIAFELSGSNEGIDGPYELIASGDIVDFAQADAWPRFTMNATPISFDNDVIYAHYQVLFPAVRDAGSANSMQIAEVELLGVRAFPPAPPIVHYKLDDGEGVIAVDSSGNGLDGILMGDPQWSAGVLDGALDFDGVDDYVDCGTSEALNNLSDAMTVSAWVNIRSVTTTWMGIVMKGETAWRLGVNGDTTGIHWGFTGGDRGWQAANSVTELSLGEWHHIAGTYETSVGATVYVDGVAETVNPDADGVRTNEMPLLLGENPEALGRLFDGLLDDVRIYDRALSADEISQLSGNILANGGFENGVVEPWSTYGDATAEVVQEAPIEGSSCLHVVVGSAGANFWDSGLQHAGHVFEAGKQYTLSAFLKCSQGTLDINFKPEIGEDPWTGYGSQAFTMTEEWTEFSVTTPVFDADVSPATITFHIGYAAADFWIDGVRFVEVQ